MSTDQANPGARDTRWLCLGVCLFLSSSSSAVSVAMVALGGMYWDCQTNATDGGHALTQAQAAADWLAKFDGLVQSGPCGALGTRGYSFCPLSDRNGTPQGAMDVHLVCGASESVSLDGVTCPGRYFVSTDPVDPTDRTIMLRELDIPAPNGLATGAFERFYNSASPDISDLVTGWSHSFSRRIVANVQATPFRPHFSAHAHDSSLYADPGHACTSGWGEIKTTSPQWPDATSSYINGVCSLSQNGTIVATLQIWNASSLPRAIAGTAVSFEAVRDDGQRVSFTVQDATIVPTADSGFRLSRTGDGYQLIDAQGNTEIYGATGKLVFVTTHTGILETLTYDSNDRLAAVLDSSGHALTLQYDSQNRLARVADWNSHSVQYGYDTHSRLQRVTARDGGSRSYVYEISTAPYLLTAAIEATGARDATWKYDALGRGERNSTGRERD